MNDATNKNDLQLFDGFPRAGKSYAYSTTLSVRQLVDVELGLYLITVVSPGASANVLPDLFQPDYKPDISPRQRMFLSRGKILLAPYKNRELWLTLLTNYINSPAHRLAFDVEPDSFRILEKVAGFSRNRISVLRKMLA